MDFEELPPMAVRGVLYIHLMYSLPASMAQRQTRADALSREETNQMSAWPHPKGSWVPLSINGKVSLVTLDQISPTPS
jgi:hypothetical protein